MSITEVDELDYFLAICNARELVSYLMNNLIIAKEIDCSSCSKKLTLVKYLRNKDMFRWRCYTNVVQSIKKYISIKVGSFFSKFSIDIREILNFILDTEPNNLSIK
ncbi:hypothetical protein DMUE_1414 [Dictyocoela muelleri]|nr:hypothetical protein DMUE_1414 [Dictyocoela muelleri]